MPIVGLQNNAGISELGGLAVRLANNSGAPIAQYDLVDINPSADGVMAINADSFDPMGVAYETIANGATGWIVVSGIAQVKFDGSTTRGHVAVVSDTAAGRAKSIAVPSGTPAQTNHWQELGHILDTVGDGAGSVAKVVLHFN